jgi:hypothetical protein
MAVRVLVHENHGMPDHGATVAYLSEHQADAFEAAGLIRFCESCTDNQPDSVTVFHQGWKAETCWTCLRPHPEDEACPTCRDVVPAVREVQ